MEEQNDGDRQQNPVTMNNNGPSKNLDANPSRKGRQKIQVPKNFKFKEFGVILVSKNTDLVTNYYTYKTCTFNSNIIKEWSARNQVPQYLTTLITGPTPNDKVINKITSVQISSNSEVISTGEEQGAASMGWLDKNGDLLINVTSRIW